MAFTATITVERLISSAPAAGERRIRHAYNTPAAIGMATALYPVAQNKFCTILLYVALPAAAFSQHLAGHFRQARGLLTRSRHWSRRRSRLPGRPPARPG